MKKKAFILVNLIVIMTFLNMIILTAFIIQKKSVNSSKLAINNKEKEIYNASKSDIIDYELLSVVKTSFKEIEEKNSLDEKSLYNTVNGHMRVLRFKSIASISNDMRIQKSGNSIESDNKLEMTLSYKYDEHKQNKVYYELNLPLLTQDDIAQIRDKKSSKVYDKYKDDIIKTKYIY